MSSSPTASKVKLQKYLIHHQLAQSNRHVKKLIADGLVFVNGVEARSVSIKVALDDAKGSVFVKKQQPEQESSSSSSRTTKERSSTRGDHHQTDEASKHQHQLFVEIQDANNNPCILFYKPCGMICTTTTTTTSNPEFDTTTLVNISPPLPSGFHAVGRLDQHSHGLLLCSRDGRLTSALLSPRSKIARVYTVIVQGDVVGDETYKDIIEHVKNGVHTEYGTFTGCILDMKRNVDRDYVHSHCDPNRGCRKDKYEDAKTWNGVVGDGDCNNNNKQKEEQPQILSSITIQVEEGKKRMVRRLFAALNLPVLDLRRDKYGGMELLLHDGVDNGLLRPGQWRYADANEVAWCRKLMQAWSNDGGKGWDIQN
jgi:pseudouridine synthase